MAGPEAAEHHYQPQHLRRQDIESAANPEAAELAMQESLALLAEDLLDLADMPEDMTSPPICVLEVSPTTIAYDVVEYRRTLPGHKFVERVLGVTLTCSEEGVITSTAQAAHYRGTLYKTWDDARLEHVWRPAFEAEPLIVPVAFGQAAIESHQKKVRAEIDRRAIERRRRYMLGKSTINLM